MSTGHVAARPCAAGASRRGHNGHVPRGRSGEPAGGTGTTTDRNAASLGWYVMQGFAITTGRPLDDRFGDLALRKLAVPFTRITGKNPQLLARFVFSLTCLLWVVGPAIGGGYTKDLLGNGLQMLVTLFLLWLGLRLSWQIGQTRDSFPEQVISILLGVSCSK